MRWITRTLVCWLALIVLGLAATATAPAQGGGGGGNSAGKSQYVDPLHNPGHHHGSGTPPAPQGSSSGTSSSPSSGSSSTLSSSAPAKMSSGSSAQRATGRTLPYTGLNLEACLAVGAALLLTGVGLRRVLAAR